jgi:IS1 family transposase
MAGAQPSTSCRNLFKQLEILPVPCPYIFSLMNFFISNQENFKTSLSIHNTNTRNKHHLHRPNANLSCFKKSTLYVGIKIFNSLQRSLRILKKEKPNLNEP